MLECVQEWEMALQDQEAKRGREWTGQFFHNNTLAEPTQGSHKNTLLPSEDTPMT
jgi:hypothetical protein